MQGQESIKSSLKMTDDQTDDDNPIKVLGNLENTNDFVTSIPKIEITWR